MVKKDELILIIIGVVLVFALNFLASLYMFKVVECTQLYGYNDAVIDCTLHTSIDIGKYRFYSIPVAAAMIISEIVFGTFISAFLVSEDKENKG